MTVGELKSHLANFSDDDTFLVFDGESQVYVPIIGLQRITVARSKGNAGGSWVYLPLDVPAEYESQTVVVPEEANTGLSGGIPSAEADC